MQHCRLNLATGQHQIEPSIIAVHISMNYCVFRFVMKKIGDQLSAAEVEDMIMEADQDEDGRISFEGEEL